MGGLLKAGARWLLLGALCYAPWAYASIPPGALRGLHLLLGLVIGCWLAACLLNRHWPRVPALLVLPAVWLAFQAWWMALNGPAPGQGTGAVAHLPGSVNRSLSLPLAVQATLLLGTILLVCDLAGNSRWRRRIWIALAGAGASIALLGLVQRVAGAPGTFWTYDPTAPTFFATFPYHANAGAFLNLVWPLVAGRLLLVVHKGGARNARVFWALALLACLVAVPVNTSRASGFLGLLLAALWGGWLFLTRGERRLRLQPASTLAAAVGLFLVAAALAGTIGVDRTLARWQQLAGELNARNARWRADVISLRIVREAGLLGFGPGTFVQVFPEYVRGAGLELEHAHNDYLQAVIEWGLAGALVGGLLLVGGPLRALQRRLRPDAAPSVSDDVFLFAAGSALLGVALHALVDYPLQIPSIQLYVAVLIGLCWGFAQHHRAGGTTAETDTSFGTLGDWTRHLGGSGHRHRPKTAAGSAPDPDGSAGAG